MVQCLFRQDLTCEEEFLICKEVFPTVEYRTDICNNSLIFGRYSVLPFYNELEYDIETKNSILINSYSQHKYIANFEYYDDVKEYTFPTYFKAIDLNDNDSYVVKGTTNSRKFSWNSMMFAKNKKDAILIANELLNDSLIGQQDVIFRKYIPLETFEIGINDMPITNEWRFFYLGENVIDYGYYWSILDDYSKIKFEPLMLEFANKIAKIISKKVNFFVLDIAKTSNGDYVLVEINDAQMSGLSTINKTSFYNNLKNRVENLSFALDINKWLHSKTTLSEKEFEAFMKILNSPPQGFDSSLKEIIEAHDRMIKRTGGYYAHIKK